MRILNLLFFPILICTLSCSSIHYRQTKNKIIYRVFDSLENYILQDIDKHKPDNLVGVIIEPASTETKAFYNTGETHIWYGLTMKYANDGYPDILKKSNRSFSFGNKLYPIYFMWFDDDFAVDNYDRKKQESYAHFSKPSQYMKPVESWFPGNWIYVNVTQKVFFVDGVKRGEVLK